MIIIGLTGGISSGKSTVGHMVKEDPLNMSVLDFDKLGREVMNPGTSGYNQVLKDFGRDILLPDDRTIDRTKLGQIIFHDPEKRRKLNSIIHPKIMQLAVKRVMGHFFRRTPYLVLEVPLLFEEGKLLGFLSTTVLVHCDQDKQLDRLMSRDNISKEEALKKINCQMPLCRKKELAKYHISSNGSMDETRAEVCAIFHQIQQNHSSTKSWLFVDFHVFLIVFVIGTIIVAFF